MSLKRTWDILFVRCVGTRCIQKTADFKCVIFKSAHGIYTLFKVIINVSSTFGTGFSIMNILMLRLRVGYVLNQILSLSSDFIKFLLHSSVTSNFINCSK